MEEGKTSATAEMGPSKVLFTLETYCFAAVREYENGTQMGWEMSRKVNESESEVPTLPKLTLKILTYSEPHIGSNLHTSFVELKRVLESELLTG